MGRESHERLNQNEKNGLPRGWTLTTLGNVLPISYGKGLVRDQRQATGNIQVFGSSGIVGRHDEALTNSATLVVGRKGSVGEVYYSSLPCWPIDTTYYAEAKPNLYLPYYYYLLSSLQLGRLDKSTAIPGLSRDDYNRIKVNIAPLPEQHRIVAEIEKQFSRLDAAVAALKRVKANLKRYRATILHAACEGHLVPTEAELARQEGRDYESADVLLQRILCERRARWEAEQLAKMEAQGRLPLNDTWKAKYQEPAAPDTASLPELPKGWCWVSFEALTVKIGDVDHKMPKPADTNIPYVSTRDFQGENDINFERAKRISQDDYTALCRKIKPEQGDLLLSRYGTVGEVRHIKTSSPFQVSYSVAIIKTLNQPVLNHLLVYILRSDVVQKQIKRDIRATAQPDLGLEYIRQFAIPLPPLTEQERIVAEVERRLSIVDEVQATVAADLKRAERMRQAILQRAFSGKLVPQDPNDEPASVLLERIRAEQEGKQSAGASIKRKGTKRGGTEVYTPQLF